MVRCMAWLLAALDGTQRFHVAAREALSDHEGALLLSPFVLTELNYLLSTRVETLRSRA